MKKIKSKKIKIFIIGILIFSLKINAQITGYSSINPGINETYNWSVFAGMNPVWSSNNPSNVTISSSGPSAVVNVSKNINTCQIILTVTYDYLNTDGSITSGLTSNKTIDINPFLTGPSVIYPGQSITITNKDNCSGNAGHNSCYWNWSCSDISALSCGGSCNGSPLNTANINCPSTLPAGISSSGVYNITCNKYCGGGSYQYPSQLSITVALNNPTITGPQGVGCGGTITTGLVYTASSITGASYYAWTVPSGWSITNGANTNVITVSSNGSNGGAITVRAFAANGSAVKSNIVTYNVGCCITNLPISSNVNSGAIDQQQADNSITATNTINNGGTARYHAGNYLSLSPGFSALQGSYFHAYVEGCTGNYFRKANPSDSIFDTEETSSEEYQMKNLEQVVNNDFKQNELNVFPNPTNGEFKLVLNRNYELPSSIKIKDVFGKEIESITTLKEYEYSFDLKNYTNGIYFINVIYSDKTISRKLVKN